MWQSVVQALGPGHLPWTILWLGLAALIVGLIVLTRTSWGHSNSLQKCVAMSLLAHLLLAAYATTVQIVSPGSPAGKSDNAPVNLTLVDDGAPQTDTAAPDAKRPWDDIRLSTAAANPDAMQLPPVDLLPATDVAPAVALERDATAPATTAVADLAPPLRATPVSASIPTPAVKQSPAAATAIEPPAAAQRSDPPTPDAAAPPDDKGPARAAIGPPDTHDVQPASAAANSPTPSIAPAPDTNNPPLEPVVAHPAIASTLKTSPAAATKISPSPPATNSAAGAGPNSSATPNASAQSGATGSAGSTSAAPVVKPAPQPEIYKERTDTDRLGILRRHGGSPETEAAVQAALKWLALHQSADGHWDADKYGAGQENNVLGHDRRGAGAKAHTGVTGLALLALMASGNTHRTGPYADNVRRGLNYLLSVQRADGDLGGDAELFAFMYCHGMATFSMSEAYAMTHEPRLEAPLRSAIGYTLAAQHPTTGGWRYRPGDSGDTSQLGWQLMSLKSADLAGVKMPDATRAGVGRFLTSVSSGQNGGLAAYRQYEAPTRSMTAEALVCRQFLGMARDNPAANEAGDFLLGELPSKEHVNLYYWYYGTCAMFQLQGAYWERWNSALQGALLDQQSTSGDTTGSWDPNCIWGGYGGRVYSTAMSALCLEVYYRYLPLYGNGQPGDAAP